MPDVRANHRDLPEYHAWHNLKSRCLNPNNPYYKYYGGRGIRVCKRWRASYEAFYEDMGAKPAPHLSIERIDNDGNYSCGYCSECIENGWTANCRWATSLEQSLNRRKRTTANQRSIIPGVTGTTWNRRARKWQATIRIRGKSRYLGIFSDRHDAHEAYLQALALLS